MSEPIIKTVTIKTLEQKSSKNGKSFWKAVDSDNEYYSIWKVDVKDRLQPNIPTNIVIEQNDVGGKLFQNIIGIAPSTLDSSGFYEDTPTNQLKPQPSVQTTNPLPSSDVSNKAVRMKAVELTVQMIVHDKCKTADWIVLSNKFVDYINNTPRVNSKLDEDLDAIKYIQD